MKTTLLILISLFFYTSLNAQEAPTGQICVRAFEDLNNNQIRDQGEIPIQENLIANLLDAEGIIIDSALIEDSATRSQGLICFRDLAPNTYTLSATSVAYIPTTDHELTITLADGDLPVVLEFGGQSTIIQAEIAPESSTLDPTLERFLVAGFGAVIAMGLWMALGAVILFFIIRPKQSTDPTRQTDSSSTDPNQRFRPPPTTPSDDYEF